MGETTSQQVDGRRRVLVIANKNDSAFAEALTRTLENVFVAQGNYSGEKFEVEDPLFLVNDSESVADILESLKQRNTTAHVVYLDAQLVYKGCPSPSDCGGVKLVQHIRLTPEMGRLSLLPIVIGTVDSPEWLIRHAADNAIIFSDRCKAVKLPTLLVNLREGLQLHRKFESLKEMRDAIKPFVWHTEHDTGIREHAYRNRAGVDSFLKNFAGLEESDPGYECYTKEGRDNLWFKKAQFLWLKENPNRITRKTGEISELIEWIKQNFKEVADHIGENPNALLMTVENRLKLLKSQNWRSLPDKTRLTNIRTTRAEIRSWVQRWIKREKLRFIFIDDDHNLGWSYGLYCGLHGCSIDYQLFNAPEPSIDAQNGRLICFSDANAAEKFFDEERNQLQDVLGEWTKSINGSNTNSQTFLEIKNKVIAPCRFTLVFLDLRLKSEDNLPERRHSAFTGIQLLSKIKDRNNFPELPVIIVSASRDARSAREATKLGADGYWIKDRSSVEELWQTIMRCLKKTELRDIWRAIRMVEEKDVLICHEWQGNSGSGRWIERLLSKISLSSQGQSGTYAQFDRSSIEVWLRESFHLLWGGDELRNPAFHDEDYPYDRVILNTGLIQELRWRSLGLPGTGDLPENENHEWKLRSLRMKVAHSYRFRKTDQRVVRTWKATPPEAIACLKFTLNRLLGVAFFENDQWENQLTFAKKKGRGSQPHS